MTGFENVLKYFELLCKMKIKKTMGLSSLHITKLRSSKDPTHHCAFHS